MNEVKWSRNLYSIWSNCWKEFCMKDPKEEFINSRNYSRRDENLLWTHTTCVYIYARVYKDSIALFYLNLARFREEQVSTKKPFLITLLYEHSAENKCRMQDQTCMMLYRGIASSGFVISQLIRDDFDVREYTSIYFDTGIRSRLSRDLHDTSPTYIQETRWS